MFRAMSSKFAYTCCLCQKRPIAANKANLNKFIFSRFDAKKSKYIFLLLNLHFLQ